MVQIAHARRLAGDKENWSRSLIGLFRDSQWRETSLIYPIGPTHQFEQGASTPSPKWLTRRGCDACMPPSR